MIFAIETANTVNRLTIRYCTKLNGGKTDLATWRLYDEWPFVNDVENPGATVEYYCSAC